MITLLCFAAISNLAIGFVLGKFHERFEWNKLISSGILPRPRKGN